MATNTIGKQQNESTHSFSEPFITNSTRESNIINKKQDSTSNMGGH